MEIERFVVLLREELLDPEGITNLSATSHLDAWETLSLDIATGRGAPPGRSGYLPQLWKSATEFTATSGRSTCSQDDEVLHHFLRQKGGQARIPTSDFTIVSDWASRRVDPGGVAEGAPSPVGARHFLDCVKAGG